MLDLNEAAIFIQVVRSESFVGAARVLGLPKSTVSRKVGALEQRLGARLLNRTTRRMYLTEAGRAFYQRAAVAVEDLQDAESAVLALQRAPTGTLRLAAPSAFANSVLAQWIAEFTTMHPDVKVCAWVANEYVDLLAEQIDLAFRAGPLGDSTLVARRLGAVPYVLAASPDYVQRRGCPNQPDELKHHDCLMVRPHAQRGRWQFAGPGGAVEVGITPRMAASDLEFLRTMAERGLGIAYLPSFVLHEALCAGRLVSLMDAWRPAGRDIYAVYPSGRFLAPRVQAFLGFVLDKIGDRLPWLCAQRC